MGLVIIRYTKMEACITPLPNVGDIREVAGGGLKRWPERLTAVPPRIGGGDIEGVTAEMFLQDTELWKKRVGYYKSVNGQLGEKGRYRNLLDMNANLGGFAAALIDDPVWVMNVVPTAASVDTLGVVYERGLIGTYQDWCVIDLVTRFLVRYGAQFDGRVLVLLQVRGDVNLSEDV